MSIFRLCWKKKLKSDFQAHCYSNVYQSSKMLYFSARNLWMRFKIRFNHLPSATGTTLFMFLANKNEKKDQCKILLGTYFRIAENAVVLCKNFDNEGKIHLVVALAVSLATSVGSDLWQVISVVTSYSRGSLTDFYKFFESVASNIPSQNISQDTSFFSGLLTMVALLGSTTPRTL